MKVVIHADDLGISRGITDRIIQTHRSGAVTRAGIVANGEAFEYAVERLKENPALSCSIHLNLVEGRCLAPRRDLELLVDSRGWFKRDFLGLLLLPILAPWRRTELRRQIRSELDAQIKRVAQALDPGAFRIDSHRYVHLLPLVFSVVMEGAADWAVREIRVVNEPLYAVGAMLGIGEPEAFLRLMDRIERVGIDVMSTGVVLGWATEALERGLITEEQTGGLALRWGDAEAYRRAVDLLAGRSNELFADLGRGVSHASSRYGGGDMALAFGRNEMPGYHTGPAGYLGFAIGARHSHLDNAGYSIDQKKLMTESLPPERIVDELVQEERWRQILSSLVVCFFARGIYTPELVCRALRVSGFDLDEAALQRLGTEIHAAKVAFKRREGFSVEDEPLPQRIFQTPAPVALEGESTLRRGLRHFRQIVPPAGTGS